MPAAVSPDVVTQATDAPATPAPTSDFAIPPVERPPADRDADARAIKMLNTLIRGDQVFGTALNEVEKSCAETRSAYSERGLTERSLHKSRNAIASLKRIVAAQHRHRGRTYRGIAGLVRDSRVDPTDAVRMLRCTPQYQATDGVVKHCTTLVTTLTEMRDAAVATPGLATAVPKPDPAPEPSSPGFWKSLWSFVTGCVNAVVTAMKSIYDGIAWVFCTVARMLGYVLASMGAWLFGAAPAPAAPAGPGPHSPPPPPTPPPQQPSRLRDDVGNLRHRVQAALEAANAIEGELEEFEASHAHAVNACEGALGCVSERATIDTIVHWLTSAADALDTVADTLHPNTTK